MTLHAAVTLLAAEDPGSSSTSWYDIAARLGLIVAGIWATWAQWVYPQIVKRREARHTPDPPATATPAPFDPLVVMIQNAEARAAALADDLEAANRELARQAGQLGRITAERDEARRRRDALQRQLTACQEHLTAARAELDRYRRLYPRPEELRP